LSTTPSPESGGNGPKRTFLDLDTLRKRLERISRILLIRLRSLGDSILTLPLVDALHCWKPGLQIDILVESRFAPVFRGHPAVHEILIMRPRNGRGEDGWSKGRVLIEIWKRRYGAVLNLHGGTTSVFLTFASGAALRIGQEMHRKSWVYNARIPPSSLVWMRDRLHTVEHQVSLMRWLALPLPEKLTATINPGDRARGRIRRRLMEGGILPGRYIVIHPSATLETKRWPAANFARLADWLAERQGLPVVFTSGANEEQVLLDIGKNTLERYHYWSDLQLDELFALIEGAALFVGNDSGPTHAAAALRKPLVVIWGSSDYTAWHPWNSDYEAVRSNLPCMPCPGYTCDAFGDPKCIREISVESVRRACERLLARLEAAGAGDERTDGGMTLDQA
jgi:ADP-heptose:LPS heptosyltransferase